MNEKKVAVVTGARRGIGLGIAQILRENGYTVVCAAKGAQMEGWDYLPCDISLAQDRERLLRHTVGRYGRVDVLVNNAGISCEVRRDVLELTEESFDRLIAVNLKGTFFMCQLFANEMIRLKNAGICDPRIVNISSVSAYAASTERAEYCISKAGVSMVTKLFAARLAEYEIPVFEVSPGIIRTDMTKGVSEKYDKLIAGGVTPVRRWGTPEDVAKCVLAAAQGLLDFGTGTCLHADGGFHIRRL